MLGWFFVLVVLAVLVAVFRALAALAEDLRLLLLLLLVVLLVATASSHVAGGCIRLYWLPQAHPACHTSCQMPRPCVASEPWSQILVNSLRR